VPHAQRDANQLVRRQRGICVASATRTFAPASSSRPTCDPDAQKRIWAKLLEWVEDILPAIPVLALEEPADIVYGSIRASLEWKAEPSATTTFGAPRMPPLSAQHW
jgi:hypothetical protein